MRNVWMVIVFISGTVLFWGCQSGDKTARENPPAEVTNNVLMETGMGDIEIVLYPDKAPIGVKNFQDYIHAGFYDGSIFHRVIHGFMIQGGGFTPDLQRIETRPPIAYEGNNGMQNLRGTLAYARTMDPNSATSQFFINHRDNPNLDHANSPSGYGYAVFGKVIRGIDVVDQIANVQTGSRPNGMSDVPLRTVEIKKMRFVK